MYTISKKENNNRKTKTEQTKDTRRIILMVSIIKTKNEEKLNKGITLITLVITIIVLLILAGVTIATLTGENGILSKAKLAKELTEEKAKEEEEKLKEYEKLLGLEGLGEKQDLPENTESTEAGTLVKLPEEWNIKRPDKLDGENGEIISVGKKQASVYAVSDGKANTVPVPYGFYYVGGTKETGFVISDYVGDKDKYKGKEDVPAGVSYNSDGTVNKETSELQGNQFVWIPCNINEYKKYDFGIQSTTGLDRYTNSSEKVQIDSYRGFYVGRYEAGTSEITLADNVKFDKASTGSSINGVRWQNGSFVVSKVTEGKITSKAGEIPYYHADYETAVEMSERMYNNEYVRSGLMTGTMWDVMIKFMAENKTDYSDMKNTPWGNCKDNTNVSYTAGVGRYLTVNSSDGSTQDAVVADNSYYYGIRTTASSEGVKKKNLYDVAGNQWEWTQEMCYITNNANLMYNLRGGGFNSTPVEGPVCYRVYGYATSTYTCYGFRSVLYIR